MNIFRAGALSAIASILLFASCQNVPSAPKFIPWMGPTEVVTGSGGTMTRVGGMDVWENGTPSRKIQLVGYISESEKNPSPVESIVALARQRGGETIVHIQHKEGVKYWAIYKYAK